MTYSLPLKEARPCSQRMATLSQNSGSSDLTLKGSQKAHVWTKAHHSNLSLPRDSYQGPA